MSILIPSLGDYKQSQTSEWSFSDNVLPNAHIFDLSVRCGGSVVSSPIEQGSFFSYNKTTEPMEINATLSFEGTNTLLQSVLNKLDTLKNSVTIFSIKTPLFEYENMNLQSYDYALRREDGLGVLYVNATFIEIREVKIAYTDTTITEQQSKDTSATSTVEGGLKQAEEPTAQEYSAGSSSAGTIGGKRQSLARQIGFGG